MKIFRSIALVTAAALLPLSVFASPARDDPKEEIPYVSHDPKIAPYSYGTMEIYTEAEAKSKGVPDGYSGHVMMLKSSGAAVGITVDFSEMNIPMSVIKALHMRVYYPDTTKEVRISIDAGVSWELRHVASDPGKWEDVTLAASGMSKLTNGDGCLGRFGFGFRLYDGKSNAVAYIDAIYVEYKNKDENPPVITYNGETNVTTTEGRPLVIDASAYDAEEERSVPVRLRWQDGALDGDGLPVKGDHVCYITATDGFGNRAEIQLNVTVKDRDTEPPVINFACDEINTVAGCIPVLGVTASDNEDEVTVRQIWSDGALDGSGRLTEGVHELKLTASDLTGNTTEKTVKINVYTDFRTDKPVINE